MGVMQHHDAITGTEKQHVAEDYHRAIDASIKACEENTKSALKQLVKGSDSTLQFDFQFTSCLNLNISSCEVPESSEKFVVTVYNPLGHASNDFVRFPISGSSYEVRDPSNVIVASQIVPIPTPLATLHYRESLTRNELVFQASGVPAMGFKSFYVTRTASAEIPKDGTVNLPATVGNDVINLNFDVNGLLSSATVDGVTKEISQNFYIYKGNLNNNEIFANRSSGAYIFRPDPLEPVNPASPSATIEVYRGDHVTEVHQIFNDWISQVVRIYKGERVVEFEWMVGPIGIEDGVGKEIISRFMTDMKTDGVFYTDANGRQMMRRKRDFRETWDLKMEEPVAGNYYPINTNIAIEDENYRLAVLNDRAQGGSSMIDGTVELMVRKL